MNPIVKIISNIVITINRLLDRIDKKTADTIRASFLFLIFILMVVGIIIGYNMGKEAARIKSLPLAEYTNQIFEADINREKKNGSFGKMLRMKLVEETRRSSYKSKDKIQFPAKEKITPFSDDRIFEQKRKKFHDTFPDERDKIFEADTKPLSKQKTSVKPLKRRKNDSSMTHDRKDKDITAPEINENNSIPSQILKETGPEEN